MKTKHRKTLIAIFAKPTKATIRFVDIESFLVSLGGKVSEGPGSRIAVTVSGKKLISTVRIRAKKRKSTRWRMHVNFCSN